MTVRIHVGPFPDSLVSSVANTMTKEKSPYNSFPRTNHLALFVCPLSARVGAFPGSLISSVANTMTKEKSPYHIFL